MGNYSNDCPEEGGAWEITAKNVVSALIYIYEQNVVGDFTFSLMKERNPPEDAHNWSEDSRELAFIQQGRSTKKVNPWWIMLDLGSTVKLFCNPQLKRESGCNPGRI